MSETKTFSLSISKSTILFWISILAIVAIRFHFTRPVYKDGDTIKISKRLLTQPLQYDDAQGIKVAGLTAYLPKYPQIYYGDQIVIKGVVKDNKLTNPELIKLTKTDNVLFKTRERIIKFYRRSLPAPHDSLVAGVVLGSKSGFGEDFWKALQHTGTAHVVVASGMNVTLVAGFLVELLNTLFKRQKAVGFALLGIWVYVMLAGFEAPLVRAAIMGSLAFGAQATGRLNQAWRALFLSAAAMLIAIPDWLTDIGFILSFVATASLMLFESKINRLVQFVPSIFREGLSTSLAAQIGVAPILFIVFQQFNILSPIINALVLWVIAPITIIGMVAGVVGLLIPSLGVVLLYLIYPLTSWFVFIVNTFNF